MPDDLPAALVPGLTLTEALDAIFAAYVERYGPARGSERLRLMLMRSYEAQMTEENKRAAGRAAE